MKFNGWNSFEDLARAYGYTTSNSTNTSKANNNSTNDFANMECGDIPNGFQSLNPELFTIIGEILGNIIAGNIPSNVQNAIGNWLELVGQAILTYNAQQQYFQGGPGRYFSPAYYNVNNPFCSTNSSNNTQNTNNKSNENKNSRKSEEKTSTSDYNAKCVENETDKIRELELRINNMMSEIEKIKSMI